MVMNRDGGGDGQGVATPDLGRRNGASPDRGRPSGHTPDDAYEHRRADRPDPSEGEKGRPRDTNRGGA